MTIPTARRSGCPEHPSRTSGRRVSSFRAGPTRLDLQHNREAVRRPGDEFKSLRNVRASRSTQARSRVTTAGLRSQTRDLVTHHEPVRPPPERGVDSGSTDAERLPDGAGPLPRVRPPRDGCGRPGGGLPGLRRRGRASPGLDEAATDARRGRRSEATERGSRDAAVRRPRNRCQRSRYRDCRRPDRCTRWRRRRTPEQGWTNWRTSAEHRLGYALGELRRIGGTLGVPHAEQEEAARLYRRATSLDCVTGRNIDAFTAACLLVTVRRSSARLPVSVVELAPVSRASEGAVRTARRALERELEVGVPPMDPEGSSRGSEPSATSRLRSSEPPGNS